MTIDLSSPAFAAGAPIPQKYTCDGANVSPPLEWRGVPGGARQIVLICDDPDAPAGTWVHWVLYCLDASFSNLPEGVPARDVLDDGACQGMNDFKKVGYGGPCPPRGKPHRYFFRIYALDAELALKSGARRADVDRAMQGHVIGRGELMGTYQRR